MNEVGRWLYLAGILAITLHLTWDAWIVPVLNDRAIDRELDIEPNLLHRRFLDAPSGFGGTVWRCWAACGVAAAPSGPKRRRLWRSTQLKTLPRRDAQSAGRPRRWPGWRWRCWPRWRSRLDRQLAWLPVDWRLLAPFFLLGAAAGAIAILWLFAVALGHGA